MHCFCDASSLLYGTAIYLKIRNSNNVKTHLIFAKARLKPISETITIPRMELLAVLIGIRALTYVKKNFPFQISRIFVWTDSKCVLSWYNSVKILPIFIRNRIKEIKNVPFPFTFRYVPSEDNPANLLTKIIPLPPAILAFWYSGPSWLTQSEDSWPPVSNPAITDEEFPTQEKSESSMLTIERKIQHPPFGLDITKYSSLSKLWRITAYSFKFTHRIRGSLTKKDLEAAQLLWLKYIQELHFSRTLENLHLQKRDEL